jgi:glycine cleavage system H protein
MATYPDNLQYTKDHEWTRLEGEICVVGISDFAQEQLGDVVHVQLPRVGEKFEAHVTPVSGEVTEVNEALADAPELVNSDPYGGGWMIKIKLGNRGEIDSLLSSSEYEDFIDSQKEE